MQIVILKRPVLLLRKIDNSHDDWLVSLISSQLHQLNTDLDWTLSDQDLEFSASGLKVASVFRLSRIAVLDDSLLIGRLGKIHEKRLQDLRHRVAEWITGA